MDRSNDPIDSELEHHIAERVDALVAEGWTRDAAQREARRRFGAVEAYRRRCEAIARREEHRTRMRELIGSIGQDIRYTLRGVVHAPAFALALVSTIGLGIGANTAIFAVVDALLLRPLPYHEPDRLVELTGVRETDGRMRFMTVDEGRAWQRISDIASVSFYQQTTVVRSDGAEPTDVQVIGVTPNWLETLGVAPALGRSFRSQDAAVGAHPAAIISHEAWQSWFGGDQSVIGQTIDLDERRYDVVGVMGRGFKFPQWGPSRLWIPILDDGTLAGHPIPRVAALARLPSGMSLAQAQARFDALSLGQERVMPQEGGWQLQLGPFDSFRANSDVRRALWILVGAVGLMLLIGMVNGVNLLLARGTVRARELAIRLSIGAGQRRLTRQLLTESIVLALASGAVAMALASLALRGMMGIVPSEVTFFAVNEVVLGERVTVYAFGLALVAGFLVGLVPAIRLVHTANAHASFAIHSYATSQPGRHRLRQLLSALEIAMTLILLTGAGLLIKSFVRLIRVDPGFEVEHLAFMSLNLAPARYQDDVARSAFFARVKQEIQRMPDVVSVSLTAGLPPSAGGFFAGTELQAEGGEVLEQQPYRVSFARPDEEFFATLRVPLMAGRVFDANDEPDNNVAVIDPDLARALWGEQNPLGRRFRLRGDGDWYQVIGVVGDVKLMGLDDRRGTYEFYVPLPRGTARSYLSFAVRVRGDDSRDMLSQLRAAVHRVDPLQPIYRLETAREAMAASVDEPRFLLLLMIVFACTGLALAAIGVYGVISFTVRQRFREVGIRAALGAPAASLRWMVLREGLVLAAVGTVVGAIGGVLVSRVFGSLLFEVDPADPVNLLSVALLMIGVTLLACDFPARWVTRVDPVAVLTSD